jgi:hypothetical protein
LRERVMVRTELRKNGKMETRENSLRIDNCEGTG